MLGTDIELPTRQRDVKRFIRQSFLQCSRFKRLILFIDCRVDALSQLIDLLSVFRTLFLRQVFHLFHQSGHFTFFTKVLDFQILQASCIFHSFQRCIEFF